MNPEPQNAAPFKTLGTHIRYLREQQKQTLAEVSGAVEIDMPALERIEDGFERPNEEVLLLLINYFDMQDQEAVQLWELAGYDNANDHFKSPQEELASGKPMMMLLALDMRTMYTDGVEIHANDAGITLHFTQANGQRQGMPVGRLGMSYDQAERTLAALQTAILQGKYHRGPKQLPPSIDR